MVTHLTRLSLGADIDNALRVIEDSLGSHYQYCKAIEGCSNKVYLVKNGQSGVRYIVRLTRSTPFHNYEVEKRILANVVGRGLGTAEAYLFADGVMTRYIEGVCIEDDTLLGAAPYYKYIAEQMRALHEVPIAGGSADESASGHLYGLDSFLRISADDLGPGEDRELLLRLYTDSGPLGQYISANPSMLWVCISHNDLHSGNILYCSYEQQVRFIDWEYAAFTLNAFDIVCFFLEFTGIECVIDHFPGRAKRHEFYEHYFGGASDTIDSLCLFFLPLACFFWSAWARNLGGLEMYVDNRRRMGYAALHEIADVLGMGPRGSPCRRDADHALLAAIEFSFRGTVAGITKK